MFINNKYKSWHDSIIDRAKSQHRKKLKRSNDQYVYYEKHHIIPSCMGGTEIVLLTAKEHFICHLLLCKFTIGKNRLSMINALIKMQFSKSEKQERYTSKSYNIVRSLIASKNSEMFKGIPKSKETRKRISQGRKGMKFSETHKANISKFRKTQTGEKNSFFGKKHTDELKLHWSKIRKGRPGTKGSRGMKWYNNGIEEKMLYPENTTDGWIKGRLPFNP